MPGAATPHYIAMMFRWHHMLPAWGISKSCISVEPLGITKFKHVKAELAAFYFNGGQMLFKQELLNSSQQNAAWNSAADMTNICLMCTSVGNWKCKLGFQVDIQLGVQAHKVARALEVKCMASSSNLRSAYNWFPEIFVLILFGTNIFPDNPHWVFHLPTEQLKPPVVYVQQK